MTNILSISLPPNLRKAMNKFSRSTGHNTSELVRAALREYIVEHAEERDRFIQAYKATRKERLYTLDEVKKKYDL